MPINVAPSTRSDVNAVLFHGKFVMVVQSPRHRLQVANGISYL
jgi:hypothetical protein